MFRDRTDRQGFERHLGQKTCPKGTDVAQGFTGGFIRGLALGTILLCAVSIYVGPVGTPQGGRATGDQASTQQNTNPPETTQPETTRADTVQAETIQDETAPTEPALPEQSATQKPAIAPLALPDDPVISAQEAAIPAVPPAPNMPQAIDDTGKSDTFTSGNTAKLPAEPDTEDTTLPDLDQIVVIQPDNAIAPAAVQVPSDPDASTPPLPVPAAPKLAPRRTPDRVEIDTDYTPVETPQNFYIETVAPITGDPLTVDRAIRLHATDPEILDGRPLVALALIAGDSINLTQLDDLGFPVSIVLPAEHPDAHPWSEALRAKNHEVIVAVDLAEITTAQEIEVNLATILSQIPKSVAILEHAPGGFQKSRVQTDVVPDILSRSGHGLITYRNGLNTIQKNAQSINLPAGFVSENLTDLTQEAAQRRLERMVLEATKPGNQGVLIVAPLTSQTVKMLSDWAAQERTQRLQVVPVSQYLTILSQD